MELESLQDVRGVDVSQIRRQLRMTVPERVAHMVEVTNRLMEIRSSARLVGPVERR